MKKTILPFLFLIGFVVSGQTESAWVYFTDKENVSAALANPISILSQAAIDRKNLHGTPIDVRDVPVNETYISQIKNLPGITVYAKSKWFNCVFVRGLQPDVEALENLTFVDHVEFADPQLNGVPRSSERSNAMNETHDKFEINTDFDYGQALNQVEMLHVDYLHEQGFTGEGILIAILDAGFPNVETNDGFDRMRNNGNLLDGYDFVDSNPNEFAFAGSSHGAKVLSCITGFVTNDYAGTAPDASAILFRTEDVESEMPIEMAYWVEAAERADSLGVYVVNTSLGYNNFDNSNYSFQTSDMDGQTAFISKGANIAFEKGMLMVCSAGNSGNDAWEIITAPGDAPGAFTIGAVDPDGNYAAFSSRGPTADGRVKPDVVAQGAPAAVITTFGNVSFSNGTSFSSPIMAGAIASLWQADPSKTNAEIMQLVRESSSQFENPDIFLGYGIPNFQIALENLSMDKNILNNVVSIYPNPVENVLFVDFSKKKTTANIEVFSLLGKRILKSVVHKNKPEIDLSNLMSGIYLLKITSKENSSTFKIVKK
ncbi:MAG TPA: S8 family serine peptidase [Flavobacteriaceae bacterium]|nr:S8 family serine peptidase [Flavobacteriaceae bacterium]